MHTKKIIPATFAASGLLLTLAPGAASAASAPEDTYLVVTTGGISTMTATTMEATVESAGGTNVTAYSEIGTTVATLTATEAAALDAKPNVVVAKDGKMSATGLDKGPITAADINGKVAPIGDSRATAVSNSWGLDRVDQRSAALNGQYNLPPGTNGTGTHVYVFDTGIALHHPEFAGRIGASYDFVGDGYGARHPEGHGTHVAGTIGSSIFGVAPKATLHSVRVLDADGSGYWSDYISALNTIAAVAPVNSVANSSLAGPYNAAVDQAVANFVARGTPMVVAAGNEADDVSYYSPASTTQAITVAASEEGDLDASYSNFGEEIDLYAPGTDIWSTYYADPTMKYRMSGTSMASPHVAGDLALYLRRLPPRHGCTGTGGGEVAGDGQRDPRDLRWHAEPPALHPRRSPRLPPPR